MVLAMVLAELLVMVLHDGILGLDSNDGIFCDSVERCDTLTLFLITYML